MGGGRKAVFRKNWQFCLINNAFVDMSSQQLEQKCYPTQVRPADDTDSSASLFHNLKFRLCDTPK
jgi:hypothetical protein